MVCTEEDTAIDHMIATFRAKYRMTLEQLMEVDEHVQAGGTGPHLQVRLQSEDPGEGVSDA